MITARRDAARHVRAPMRYDQIAARRALSLRRIGRIKVDVDVNVKYANRAPVEGTHPRRGSTS